MDIFGHSYPAGTQHDPSAPYNQADEPDEIACLECGEISIWDDIEECYICTECDHEEGL